MMSSFKLGSVWAASKTLHLHRFLQKQTVYVNESNSDLNLSGNAQGSFLEPVLLSIYIHDLPSFIETYCDFLNDIIIRDSHSGLMI